MGDAQFDEALVRPQFQFKVVPADPHQPSVRAGCGHRVWREEQILIGKRVLGTAGPAFPILFTWFPDHWWRPERCTMCEYRDAFDRTILCAFCLEPILPGEPVNTYSALVMPEDFDQTTGTATKDGYVGCKRRSCPTTEDVSSGQWTGDGVSSPFEGGEIADDIFSTGTPVILGRVERR